MTREKSMLGSFKVSTDDENTPADGEVMSHEEEMMRSVGKQNSKALFMYLPPLISLRKLSAELE